MRVGQRAIGVGDVGFQDMVALGKRDRQLPAPRIQARRRRVALGRQPFSVPVQRGHL